MLKEKIFDRVYLLMRCWVRVEHFERASSNWRRTFWWWYLRRQEKKEKWRRKKKMEMMMIMKRNREIMIDYFCRKINEKILEKWFSFVLLQSSIIYSCWTSSFNDKSKRKQKSIIYHWTIESRTRFSNCRLFIDY